MIKVTKTAIAEALPDMRYIKNQWRYRFVGDTGCINDDTQTIDAITLCFFEDGDVICDIDIQGELRWPRQKEPTLTVDITGFVKDCASRYTGRDRRYIAEAVRDIIWDSYKEYPNARHIIVEADARSSVVD